MLEYIIKRRAFRVTTNLTGGVPWNFVREGGGGGGSKNPIEDSGQGERVSGDGSPL
jgi:hypothetical protein